MIVHALRKGQHNHQLKSADWQPQPDCPQCTIIERRKAAMTKCDHAGCEGHLGKFSSCLTEALWQSTLDGTDESTGTTEAYGHYSLMLFNFDEALPLGEGRTITVPAGAYIVACYESGAVFSQKYGTEAEARKDFEDHERDYGEWLDKEESEV